VHSSLAWLPRLLLGGVLLGAVLYFLPLHDKESVGIDDIRLPLPEFHLTDQNGNPVEGRDLIGKVWIASFVFTRCAGPCPQVSATMARIHKQLADKPDVLLLTFSVDPENDDPNALREYAERYGADSARWRFLTGKPEEMRKLLRDGFRIAAEPAPGEKHAVTHSTKLALVDRSGWIRGYFDSLPNLADENVEQAQRDFERNLHRLYEKTAELLREGT
jgi:cytochrome oxidase Cu insertion factor (SCO1/SenC/PrrC family)